MEISKNNKDSSNIYWKINSFTSAFLIFSLIHISAIVTGVDQVRLNDNSLVISVLGVQLACFGKLGNRIIGRSKKSCPERFPAAAWDKLNAKEANTEAMLDRLDNLEQRVDIMEKAHLVRIVSLLCVNVSWMEKTTSRLRDEIGLLKQHAMKYNLNLTIQRILARRLRVKMQCL